MDLDQIPGLKRARQRAAAREAELRRRVFFPSATRIAGIPVLPFTPRHFMLCDEAQSPLVFGGPVSAEQIAQFLWIVSPRFLLPTHRVTLREVKAERRAFTLSIAAVRFGRARTEIAAYLDAALFDAPNKSSGDSARAPVASLAASFIHEFARAYAWKAQALDERGQPIHGEGILDMPMAWLLQLRRLIAASEDPDAFLPNPLSDQAELDAIKCHKARLKKRQSDKTAGK